MAKSNVKGLDSLLKKLNSISNEAAEKAMTRGIQLATITVQDTAQDIVPKDSTGLERSITSRVVKEPDKVVGVVGTNMSYAPYVEFGTGQRGNKANIEAKKKQDLAYKEDWPGMEPQPFLYPALKYNKKQITKDIAEELHKELAKYKKR